MFASMSELKRELSRATREAQFYETNLVRFEHDETGLRELGDLWTSERVLDQNIRHLHTTAAATFTPELR